MLIKPYIPPTKNPKWAIETPNERYLSDPLYKNLADAYQRGNGIPGHARWWEVRIVHQSSIFTFISSWWDEPMFMDKIFWVYQTPFTIRPAGKEPYQMYAMELFESKRINQLGYDRYGFYPVAEANPCFIIPVDVCQLCWDETSGGVSDHIRPREVKPPTQEEVDRESALEEYANKKMEEIEDVSNDPKWQNFH